MFYRAKGLNFFLFSFWSERLGVEINHAILTNGKQIINVENKSEHHAESWFQS